MPESNEQSDGALAGVASAELLANLKWLDAVQKTVGEDCTMIAYKGVVEKPQGYDQCESCELYDELRVKQTAYSCGDSYYGEICVRKEGVWISFYFEC